MRQRLLLLFLLSCASSATVYALTSIRGFVTDATTGEPLPMATVVIKGEERGSSTNLDGFFVIPGLHPGRYTLVARYMGYQTLELETTVNGKDDAPLTIEITPTSLMLDEVVYSVAEQDEDALRRGPSVSTVPMSPQTIREVPSLLGEHDVLRAVQTIPGVKASSELSSALYVRGGNRDMTLLALDQCTVYNPAHMFGLFSTFNSEAVKHITLMKGGFPAEYGGRAGSVLQVVTKDGNRREYEGSAMVSSISARAAIEGPLPKDAGSLAFSARRTYFDPLINGLKKVDKKEFGDIPLYYFYDSNGKVTLDLTRHTILTVGGYMGRDDLEGSFGDEYSQEEIESFWGNRTVYGRLRQVVGRNSFLTATAAHSEYRSGFEDHNEGILLAHLKNRFRETSFRADFEMLGLEHHQVKTGVQVSRFNTSFLIENEELVLLDFSDEVVNYSHYLQDSWRISPLWEARPGVRWYYHQQGDFLRVDPRLAVVHHWNDRLRLKLAGGRYTQWVNIVAQGETFSALDIWTAIDGTVDPTYADQIVFGVEYDYENDLEMTAEVYYNDIKDVLFFDENSDNAQAMQDAYLSGEGYAYGFEWMLRRKAGRLSGWFGYSLAWTQHRFPGTDVNNGDWFYPKWDRRHDFMVVGRYQLNPRWSLSASWLYNTGQGHTRGEGVMTREYARINPAFDDSFGREIVYGSVNNYRLPADHRLDVTFGYDHLLMKRYRATMNFSVYNVYSRRALFYRGYNTEVNPVKVQDVRLLPILPLVSYEVRF